MKVLPWILCIVLSSILLFRCGRKSVIEQVYYDTIPFYDTIKYDTLIPRDSVVIKYVSEKLPVLKDSISCDSSKQDILQHDSVKVVIPITQKHYKENDFEAWVSGYKAALDSIHVYPEHFYLKEKVKRKRWGIGLQVGYCIVPGNHGVYGGIGVSYNLFGW